MLLCMLCVCSACPAYPACPACPARPACVLRVRVHDKCCVIIDMYIVVYYKHV